MVLYRTILVALKPDTAEAKEVLIKASVIARQNKAELHVAYVETLSNNFGLTVLQPAPGRSMTDMELLRLQQLKELAQHIDYPIHTFHLANGSVIDHLLKLAKKLKVDLVIAGRHSYASHWFEEVDEALNIQLQRDLLICH